MTCTKQNLTDTIAIIILQMPRRTSRLSLKMLSLPASHHRCNQHLVSSEIPLEGDDVTHSSVRFVKKDELAFYATAFPLIARM